MRNRFQLALLHSLSELYPRLFAPIINVIPSVADTSNVRSRFALFSTVVLLIGSGQFVILEPLISLSSQTELSSDAIKLVLLEHRYLIASTLISVIFLVLARRQCIQRKWTLFFALFMTCLAIANYRHFFLLSGNGIQAYNLPHHHVSVDKLKFKAYPGISGVYDAQAVNLVYFGHSPRSMMEQLGWIENKTFSQNALSPFDYLMLLKEALPPVSDLFWNGVPQAMAFQEEGNLLERSHIRWWKAGYEPNTGREVWVGAISYDDGLKLGHYSGLITLLHKVDPDVDSERDRFAYQIASSSLPIVGELQLLAPQTNLDHQHDYYSDGKILLISEFF